MLKDLHIVRRTVPVLVPVPAERPYSYLVPDDLPEGKEIVPGSIVQVPLGPRVVSGIVTGGATDVVEAKKLRSIIKVFDSPPIDNAMLRFIQWAADYTLSPPGLVAKMVLRAPAAFDPEPMVPALRYNGASASRLTDARRRVLEVAGDGQSWTKTGLAHAAGVTASVVEGLNAQGLFEAVNIAPPPVVTEPDINHGQPDLSEDQREGADCLIEAVAEEDYSVTLLHGVTGSGKTEVYFEAVAKAIELGKQVLILLPEIALTQQFLDRFERRFGSRPAEWHSDMAPRQRERVWRQVADGTVKVVAGARSALFLPFANPGLIVVDEEHDPAYKQEDRVFYNARDMAVVRGFIGKFAVILASATPSIETLVNAQQGRYRYVQLAGRYNAAELPQLKFIDMRRSPPKAGSFLSPALNEAIAQTLVRKEQALLFLNRRGYAPLTLCRVCGHRFQCPDCSSWLVEHRFRKQLMCHQCGYHEHSPESCPSCGTLDHLVACGPGVERIAEEVAATFPDARIIVLSSDMAGGVQRLRLELEAIAKGEADIIIGTQLVAKGHNFPLITLVGVIDADLGLANGDPRAAERTFQLLNQVTGRAGRTGRKSLGLLQTYQPEHPVIQAIISGNEQAFYDREIEERQLAMLPPFGRLSALIVSADNRADAESHARGLRRAAPTDGDIEVMGPAEAALAVIRGRHRFRLLVQGSKRADMQAFMRAMLKAGPKIRGSVKVQVDMDPQSFL